MPNILRRGKDDSDDEYTDTEPTPQIIPVAPTIQAKNTITLPSTEPATQ
jgi:hypothetical protein